MMRYINRIFTYLVTYLVYFTSLYIVCSVCPSAVWRTNVFIMFSTGLSVRLFVRYRCCERDILQTNVSVLMQIGTSVPWGVK